jgi:hypothetical protein
MYRTTYENDEQWSEFMNRFKAAIVIYKPWRENDPSPDKYKAIIDEELTSCLDFGVVDDKAKFDRATRPQLIADFKAWVAGEEPRLEVNEEELGKVYEISSMVPQNASFPYQWEKRSGDPQYFDSPRYRFFIQVDQECLESVLAVDDPDQFAGPLGGARYAGWVNIVNSR